MSIQSRYPAVRWAVPVAVVAIAVGGTAIASQLSASADTTLAPRTAAQLLVDLQTAKVSALSGTVVEKADLGLPQLPSVGNSGAGSSDLTSLISGNHTLRVWYAGPTKARVALMGTLGESDVIRNGRDVWSWSSQDNTASHRTLSPDDAASANRASREASTGKLTTAAQTPQQAADQALAAIDPTTVVTTDGSARVAGRDAYELVLSPKDTGSLIGQVRIAIDAVKHVPLRVQVFAKNASTPSVEVGFTQISFATPADSQFKFAPPPGVKVTQSGTTSEAKSAAKAEQEPTITGKGWTAVLSEKLPVTATQLSQQAGGKRDGESTDQLSRMLGVLPHVSGSWGSGRLLSSKMFSALLTDDGRILVGAVSPDRLYQAAAQAKP